MSTIVRLDKIGDDNQNITFATTLENGRVVTLGALASDGESFTAVAPADVTDVNEPVYIHVSVPLVYEEVKGLKDFSLTAGEVGRAYRLKAGDIITLTDDGITGTTVVGEYVVPANASTQLAAAATVPIGTTLVFEVIEKGTLGFDGAAASTLLVKKAV